MPPRRICKCLYSVAILLHLDGRRPHPAATIPCMHPGFHIDKLSDEFGQYTLVLKCAECGHERKAEPLSLSRMCGWDARLEDVAKRMRCSKCGKKRCTLKAFPPKKPRGYSALPR
jgi:rRNA maturation protein Nop10